MGNPYWNGNGIRKTGHKMKPWKCQFFHSELLFLGNKISAVEIEPEPAKILAVMEWALPTSVKDICRSFVKAGKSIH